jgi:predicted PurR-regulated permease PerM
MVAAKAERGMDQDTTITPAKALALLAAVAMAIAWAIGCFLVLRPFLSALLWAAIIVYSTWPAFRVLREKARLSPGWAAGAMVALEFVLIGVPLVFAAPRTLEEGEALRSSLEAFLNLGMPGLSHWLARLPLVGTYLASWTAGLDFGVSGLVEMVRPYAGTVAQAAFSVLLAVLSGIAEVFLAIFFAYFLYRDGVAIAAWGGTMLTRLAGPRARRFLGLTGAVTRGVVFGLLGTALVQGVMTAFGLWLAGVPRPVLLGVVAGVISILPVGAPIVWIPATLWLFAEGRTYPAIFLGLYGTFGISSADNVIRPWLISRGADLPLLLTLIGALGGVFAFGFLGLFLGPVLLAVAYTLLKDWAKGDAPEEAAGEGALPPGPAAP